MKAPGFRVALKMAAELRRPVEDLFDGDGLARPATSEIVMRWDESDAERLLVGRARVEVVSKRNPGRPDEYAWRLILDGKIVAESTSRQMFASVAASEAEQVRRAWASRGASRGATP